MKGSSKSANKPPAFDLASAQPVVEQLKPLGAYGRRLLLCFRHAFSFSITVEARSGFLTADTDSRWKSLSVAELVKSVERVEQFSFESRHTLRTPPHP